MNSVQVVIKSVDTRNNSQDGNPSRVITVEGGEVFGTASNSQAVYYISNPEYRGVLVELDLDTQGRVTRATIIGE